MNNDDSNIDVEKIVNHWIETSDEDFNTMIGLFNSKSFGWALFLWHISIEKLLKGYFVNKNKQHAPFTQFVQIGRTK